MVGNFGRICLSKIIQLPKIDPGFLGATFAETKVHLEATLCLEVISTAVLACDKLSGAHFILQLAKFQFSGNLKIMGNLVSLSFPRSS